MLVKETSIRGLRFKVYLDGTVVSSKPNQELGYLSFEEINHLVDNNYDRVMVDKYIEQNLKIPSMIKKRIQKYFDDFSKSIDIKVYCPKKDCPISLSDIERYSEFLSELQKEVLYRMLILHESGLTISQRLGINKNYAYTLKTKAIQRILAIKTVNNL
jgi:hypothetical protein